MLPSRFALSFSSWFMIPGEGMKGFEILNRASACLVKARNPKFPYKVHVIASSHVVAPWKWPKYYPLEWIQSINEHFCHYSVETRDRKGIFVSQHDLHPCVYHHPSRDLAVLHLDNEEKTLETLKELGLEVYDLAEASELSSNTSNLHFYGHDIAGEASNENDDRKPVPFNSVGEIKLASDYQIFTKTQSILPQGMCGGPVLLDINKTQSGRLHKLAGITEGIIPHDYPQEDLRHLAVFVESPSIIKFLDAIENSTIKPIVGKMLYNEDFKDLKSEAVNLDDELRKSGY